MEPHATAQMKDKRQGVGLLPALGQCRSELKAGVVGHQAVKEKRVDPL